MGKKALLIGLQYASLAGLKLQIPGAVHDPGRLKRLLMGRNQRVRH